MRPWRAPGKALVAFITLCMRGLRDFWRYQGVSQAAALAFYALLSFIPLLFLVIAIAGMIWGDTIELKHFVENNDNFLMPWVQKLLDKQLGTLVAIASRLGWASLAFIFWTSGLFFAVLQNSLILPWTRESSHKSGLWRWFLPWILGPALGFMLPLAMLAMHVAGYVQPGLEWLPGSFLPIIPTFGAWLTLLIATFVLYSLFLPLHCPTGKIILLSLLISVASLGVTTLFSRIIFSLPDYALIYGSLAGIVLFLLWLEYNMGLILWGGHMLRLWHTKTAEQALSDDDKAQAEFALLVSSNQEESRATVARLRAMATGGRKKKQNKEQ